MFPSKSIFSCFHQFSNAAIIFLSVLIGTNLSIPIYCLTFPFRANIVEEVKFHLSFCLPELYIFPYALRITTNNSCGKIYHEAVMKF